MTISIPIIWNIQVSFLFHLFMLHVNASTYLTNIFIYVSRWSLSLARFIYFHCLWIWCVLTCWQDRKTIILTLLFQNEWAREKALRNPEMSTKCINLNTTLNLFMVWQQFIFDFSSTQTHTHTLDCCFGMSSEHYLSISRALLIINDIC